MDNRFEKRESNFELLRIIAMILIVAHHSAMYNKTIFSSFDSPFNRLLMLGGKLGVNIFILISAYFMVDKKFKISRIVNLIFQSIFYSLLFYIIFCCFGLQSFDYKSFLLSSVFALFDHYWFVEYFILLLLISPLLNIVIKNLTQKQHLIICLAVAIIVLFPYVWVCFFNSILEFPGMDRFPFFICLYFIAGYIKKYGVSFSTKQIVFMLIISIIYQLFSTLIGFREVTSAHALGNFLISVLIFVLFGKFKFHSKTVNKISSHTLGVYLIHENIYVSAFWWKYFYGLFSFNSRLGYFGVYCLSVVVTYVICLFIDFLREISVHKLYVKVYKKIDEKRKVKQETETQTIDN